MWKLLVVIGFSVLVIVSAESETQCVGAGCQLNGLQIATKFVRQYLQHQPSDIVLGDGVHLVSNGDKEVESTARANDDGSLLSALETFFKSHELRIRLPELMPDSENISRKFREVMDDMNKNDLGEARRGGGGGGGGYKGGKKGGGGMMLMALMMGKTMAAIGFGTVGLLAMKALMVSALALMLSLVVGLKKLLGSGSDDHGGHTVIHATASGHGGHGEYRKKREAADMAYHAWTEYLNR